jgi:hypothetical protein
MPFLAELKRRNVVKVAGAYLALGWVVVQATATLASALNLPERSEERRVGKECAELC